MERSIRTSYQGWYCVPCERFWTEKDLAEGKCPDCLRPVNEISESNYFFRMSKYQSWLIEHIEKNERFILPSSRRNEILGFLRSPLEDLCISRPKKRLSWGIEIPFDTDYVTYVWFDALINYISGIGFGSEGSPFCDFWPEAIHLDRQGHPDDPHRLLAHHAGGDRFDASKDGLRSRLVDDRGQEDVKIASKRGRTQSSDRHLRSRCGEIFSHAGSSFRRRRRLLPFGHDPPY